MKIQRSHDVRKRPMSIAGNEYPDQPAYLCRVDQRNDCLPVYKSLSHVSFDYEWVGMSVCLF